MRGREEARVKAGQGMCLVAVRIWSNKGGGLRGFVRGRVGEC